MAKKTGYYRANQGFATILDGENVFVQKGELVSADHKLLKGREDLFDPAPTFGRFDTSEVEQATAAPGEKRGDKPAKRTRSGRKARPVADTERPAAAAEPKPESHFGLTTADIGEPQP